MRRQMRKRRRGMTLVEIMIVVVIMSMIATAVAVAAVHYAEQTNIRQAAPDAATVASAAELAQLDGDGDCPAVDELRLARGGRRTDPWGSPFFIECLEDGVRVVSPGPDEELGTDDDIEPGVATD